MEVKDFIAQTMAEAKTRLETAVEGLTPEELDWQPEPKANPIGFLLWHVARVEDQWLQSFVQRHPHVWEEEGWHTRLNLPLRGTGNGYTPQQVAGFATPDLKELLDYFNSVRRRTIEYLDGLDTEGLERCPMPDRRPEFTVARVFRQLIGEQNQHLGQIDYILGLKRGSGG